MITENIECVITARCQQQNDALFQNHNFEIKSHDCISKGILPFSHEFDW